MKLLSPSENRTARNMEAKANIDQGIQLVRKLDDLRSQFAIEETELKKIRLQDIPSAQNELSEIRSKIKLCQEEIDFLSKERAKATKPIEEELELLNVKKQELQNFEYSTNEKVSQLQEKMLEFEKKLIKDKNQSLIELQKVDSLKKELVKLTLSYNQLQKNVSKKEAYLLKLEAAGQAKIKQLALREQKVAIRERDVKLKESSLKKKELEFNRRSIAQKHA